MHHPGIHEALADADRRHQQPAVVRSHADVPSFDAVYPLACRRRPDFDDVGTGRLFGLHGHSMRKFAVAKGSCALNAAAIHERHFSEQVPKCSFRPAAWSARPGLSGDDSSTPLQGPGRARRCAAEESPLTNPLPSEHAAQEPRHWPRRMRNNKDGPERISRAMAPLRPAGQVSPADRSGPNAPRANHQSLAPATAASWLSGATSSTRCQAFRAVRDHAADPHDADVQQRFPSASVNRERLVKTARGRSGWLE